jgi:hypothetical protein
MTWGVVASVGVGLLTSGMGSSQSQSQSTQKTMDPRMTPYVFGDGTQGSGLLGMTQSQLQRAQSPEMQGMWGNMMNRGQQLMGGSIAGNPFSAGYTGGTNFGPVGAGNAGNGVPQFHPQPLAPPPAQQQQTQGQYSMDDIIAEIQRRQQAAAYQQYMLGNAGQDADGSATGGTGGGGVGNNANGDSAGVGAGPM